MLPPRVWLITGASSGLGKAVTEFLLCKGDIVVATLRRPSVLAPLTEQYPPSQLLLVTLDVTRPSDISAAFTRAKETFGRLDIVFNNAGIGMFGGVDGTPDADARALFEVNFWGVVGVSRAAVRFFREVNPPGKGGILLQNSSMMAYSGAPTGSFYCASKHAVDAFSESLSHELLPEWNIKICILQTGGFDTNIVAASRFHPVYSTSTVTEDAYPKISLNGDPYKFAEMVFRLVASTDDGEKLPLFLPVGRDALGKVHDKLNNLNKVLKDAAPWSTDLKKMGALL